MVVCKIIYIISSAFSHYHMREIKCLERERDRAFIGNQREQLQKSRPNIKCLLVNQWEQLQKELAQAFDPATIKHEGHALCKCHAEG